MIEYSLEISVVEICGVSVCTRKDELMHVNVSLCEEMVSLSHPTTLPLGSEAQQSLRESETKIRLSPRCG